MRHTDGVTAELVEEFTDWLDEHNVQFAAAFAGHADRFLMWRASAPLTTLDDDAVREFLLDWCPRQLSMPAEESWEVCEAIGEFVFFLGCTGRMAGGIERARRMLRATIGLTDTMAARMADPANFGMAKSMFAGIPGAAEMSPDELAAAMQRRVDEHNALPLDQRRAATDRFFEPPPVIELPFLYVAPPAAEVAAAVQQAALPAKMRALRDYLGETGKPLTGTGNLRLVDGRALVGVLDTGDQFDERIGSRTFTTRSTAQLGRLSYLVDLALDVKAVRHLRNRLVPVKGWAKKSALEQATALFYMVMEDGVLSARGTRMGFYGQLRNLIDEGVVHWLAPLLDTGAHAEFDDIVELTKRVIDSQFTGSTAEYYLKGDAPARDIGRIMEILVQAGAVEWSGHQPSPTDWDQHCRTGGTITLTAFGRHVLPDLLPEAGLSLRTAVDLAGADLAELITAMGSVAPEQYSALLATWQPSLPASERAGIIAAMIADTHEAHTRLFGLHLLDMFDAEAVEPHMRQLLDTDAAGHSAIWLCEHGFADPDAVGGFITPAVLLDILSELVDRPELLCEQFLTAPHPEDMLEFFWRHRAPETAAVLDVLGRHLPDRELAKKARKAAFRHRGWLLSGAP